MGLHLEFGLVFGFVFFPKNGVCPPGYFNLCIAKQMSLCYRQVPQYFSVLDARHNRTESYKGPKANVPF